MLLSLKKRYKRAIETLMVSYNPRAGVGIGCTPKEALWLFKRKRQDVVEIRRMARSRGLAV